MDSHGTFGRRKKLPKFQVSFGAFGGKIWKERFCHKYSVFYPAQFLNQDRYTKKAKNTLFTVCVNFKNLCKSKKFREINLYPF